MSDVLSQIETPCKMNELIQAKHRLAFTNNHARFIREIKNDLDTRGIAVLPDFFTLAAMEKMREAVHDRYEICLGGPVRKPLVGGELEGSIFFEVAFSDFVQDVCNSIMRPFGYHVDRSDVHPALNILQGPKARDAIHGYHFDATFLTLAVPVIMPDPTSPRPGAFRIWPNVRRFSSGWLREKFYSRVMKTSWLRDLFPSLTVNFVPGNLYFFYGFRSWHGTGDLDDQSLRANCLINVGGPSFFRERKKTLLPRNERTEP
jgi:hypothetical protein